MISQIMPLIMGLDISSCW